MKSLDCGQSRFSSDRAVELDVDGLIDTLGPDHPVPAIKKHILIRMFLQVYELGFCPLVLILS